MNLKNEAKDALLFYRPLFPYLPLAIRVLGHPLVYFGILGWLYETQILPTGNVLRAIEFFGFVLALQLIRLRPSPARKRGVRQARKAAKPGAGTLEPRNPAPTRDNLPQRGMGQASPL